MDLPDAPGRHRIRSPSAESAKPVLDLVQEAIIILDKEPEIAGESGPSLPDPPDRQGIRFPSPEWAKSMLDLVRGGAIILGLALYGAARIAEETFYRALGTSPEEVGLSYLTTVTRAAIGVVSAGTLILIYFLALQALSAFFSYRESRRARERPIPPKPPVSFWRTRDSDLLKIILSGLVSAITLFFIMWENEIALGLGAAALVPAGIALAVLLTATKSRLNRWLAAFMMLASLVGIAASGYLVGTWKADDVKTGMDVGYNPVFGVVPVSASCVNVVVQDQTIAGDINTEDEWMYLGEAESTVILYRVTAADSKETTKDGAGIPGTVRLPSGEAVFEPRDC
jgi:hypothetical protein